MSAQRRLLFFVLLLACVTAVLAADIATACPTCKDTLADSSGAERDLASGYGYSIVFMMAMPFVLLTSIGFYFYWDVRKARARAKAGLPYHAWQEPHGPVASARQDAAAT